MGTMGKILVIDDDLIITDMLKMILEENHTVLCTHDAIDGLSLARAEQPDLILLDVSMPGVDGYELCRILKTDQETKNTPIIFITANASPEDETEGLEAGAVDYITKPINPSIVKIRVGIHMELKKQRDSIDELSTLDPLTGLFSRRWFDHFLDQELRRNTRTRTPVSVILIDIDNFKTYNDNYGHIAGDECLRLVAKKLQEVPRRGGDLVARYGGEVFAVILPNTPYESLLFMTEKFRLAINKAGISHPFSDVSNSVTVSAGAATVIPNNLLSPDALVQEVEEMLYEAKRKGRNRACIRENYG